MTTRFGCPRCGSHRILEINQTYVSYEVISWNEDGTPEKFGEPEYGDGSESFDCYQCYDCLDFTFPEPARLPPEPPDA